MNKLTSQDHALGKHKGGTSLQHQIGCLYFPQTPENTGWCYKISRLQTVCD